ncbi:ATP-binding cassette domain-containing protein [Streptomyces rochei]|uniref:ATP-binding cassette domain-containing protein n=1 Tax=Streptomyces TaxID=1883 RepID=UPI0010CD5322|nr:MULTISPECIES: ATP-binding cassette domain-containing protein [unclassified Streptomyces]MBU8549248.1 ATP-binding cassette domain-containing protein [Streptomyces sp. Osf17]MBU8556027.1 ATP-binding cassette domain-containing protein [Streptomyces sp. Babs14]QCR47115.1 ABC transporter ATP-binding protein [Streptomyces sp. SGAir0924]UAX53425.1 ATP-binding cassette domain-containing protein [Streptomyces sp. A144]
MDGPHGLAVTARDFGLKGPRGWAFRDVRVDAGPGSLIAVAGPSGSGRTCLLLALTGRMRPTDGTATVGGLRLPRQMSALRRISALAHVPGVTDLDPALTVAEHLRERALLQRRFGASARDLLRPRAERAAKARLMADTALSAAGLDPETLPKGLRTAVRDLERTEALRLSIALALAGRPRLLGVDDADLKLSAAEREEIWSLLASIAASGTTVVAVCGEAPGDAVTVSTRPDTAPRTASDTAPDGGEAGDDGKDDEDGEGSAVDEPGDDGEDTADTAHGDTRREDTDHTDDVTEEAAGALAETRRA